jgi:hypothetical protein
MPDLISASLDIGETREDFMRAMGVKERQGIGAENNGGHTDYYDIPEGVLILQDYIEMQCMNFNQGNIIKAAWCLNTGRHSGTDYERELNKIIWCANRELKRIKKLGV